ncbi:molybdopterin-containing oxidoreductase family protein [Mycolicibacterium holsaticum]|uniref:molybdopterin-containing oxidoreductase family protein n=1 Tax=Mycolicibacterium holsaticum TaxID=152142 RepID=UPI001C7D5888|nr:molybdopterin-dependent oxidoreductase [Mycolicibacterium holsaticum]MDA4110315.1 formate dehydrogenase [Mycolicibacterium holsaticum DSM 44478 = JCM 12374]QZA11097.1 molybdopterin-dependent oxidoreductase [Mycolicibacterium holsaticum DSM 44478 = JCM 12374]UNC11409.1 molybdopterin-dependent oxidoreductase [Mycolicibacterium holsaticum DSM 44478 = JCM 12374]
MSPLIEHKPTFCRICEPLCGMIATVEDGRLTALRPDKDHPLSAGFACQKGIAFTEVVNDPDRVTRPLRRGPTGFEAVTWDEAMNDIANRLSSILRRRGSGAVGWYMGNPGAFSYAHTFAALLFTKGLGRHAHYFTASSQDTNSRLIASQLLYGVPTSVPIPDLTRTDLLVMMGANPLVSHGSFLTAPRIKDRMHDIVKRGGRVVIVDPRRSETAAAFEWLGIVPDTDALLLLSLLHVMFGDGLVDITAVKRQADGVDWLQEMCRPFTPESTASQTGIAADSVRALARDLVNTRRAAVYGRLGTCVGTHGTLTTFLIDAVNLVAGNLDVPGGSVFSSMHTVGQRWQNVAMGAIMRRSYRTKRSRISGTPNAIGSEPAALIAKEITTPGDRQIRAMFVSAGNPVLSVPNGEELEAAFGELELSVALDFYLTETSAHCDYILPVPTMYERDDFPYTFQAFQATPFRQATAAVLAPVGEARGEWDIAEELARRLSRRVPAFAVFTGVQKMLRRLGFEGLPRTIVDGLVRMSEGGDWFGLRRGGLTMRRLIEDHPHGVVLSPHVRTGVLRTAVGYLSRRVRLPHPGIAAEVAKLPHRAVPDGYPLRMIGLREPRSENSWMHNSPLLMRGDRRQHALMHVDDAAEQDISDGDEVRISSPYGDITVPVLTTKDLIAGVVAVPHGWGHKGTGGWRLANGAGGANVNQLTSSDPDDVESLSGMAWLTGVPVRVQAV